jgi:hypothetical protein
LLHIVLYDAVVQGFGTCCAHVPSSLLLLCTLCGVVCTLLQVLLSQMSRSYLSKLQQLTAAAAAGGWKIGLAQLHGMARRSMGLIFCTAWHSSALAVMTGDGYSHMWCAPATEGGTSRW